MQGRVFLLYVLTTPVLAASQSMYSSGTIPLSTGTSTDSVVKKNYIGFEVIASILPPAKITREEGTYSLKSNLQSAYTIGLNYKRQINKKLSFSTGLHFILGKRNFFVDIPDEDVNGWDGRKLIEDKSIWGAFRIPILFEKVIRNKKNSSLSFNAGLSARYSGFMPNETIRVKVLYPNNQFYTVFDAEISGNNNRRPWITFLTSASRIFKLDNLNLFSFSIQADISPTNFFNGYYEITIPNQPITSGRYKVSGTSLGLSVQYTFTGANKKLLKKVLVEGN